LKVFRPSIRTRRSLRAPEAPDLAQWLKGRGTKTVIVVDTAAHGDTASGATMRAMKVAVPVDGVSADNASARAVHRLA
jgi:nicotinamidase-related amidase